MKTLRMFFLRLRGLLPDKYRELDRSDEIEANLQLHIDDNLRRGMTPEAARREAMLKLGGLESTKEAYRDQASLPLVENVLRDVRFAIRQVRKNPGFACTAVLTLVLGMCASIAILLLSTRLSSDPSRTRIRSSWLESTRRSRRSARSAIFLSRLSGLETLKYRLQRL